MALKGSHSAPTVSWPGQILKDTYRIDHQIGEGGTGLVFSGFHLRLKVAVAVKILKQSAGGLAFARFRKEAEVTARLRHPNIVQILDYDVTPDGHAYIITEWLEGETMAAYMKREGPLSPAVSVALLGPVCEAVGAAHAEGVVHRDLKPANLFLARPPGGAEGFLIKVLDFGIAKLTDIDPVSTEQGQTVGTPRYMSPEQIKVESVDQVGPASDQFSLGGIAYEMVAGRPAFPGSAQAAMLAVLDCRPEPLSDALPAPFRAALARALSREPGDRYPSVVAFADALRAALDAPTQVSSPPAAPRGAMLLVGGLAFVVVILLLVLRGPAEPMLPLQSLTPADMRSTSATVSARAPVAAAPADAGAAEYTVTPLDLAAPPSASLLPVRFPPAPSGGQLYVNELPVRPGASVLLPEGVPARVRLVAPAPRRRCCPSRELSFTPAPGKRPPTIELRCDKNCLW